MLNDDCIEHKGTIDHFYNCLTFSYLLNTKRQSQITLQKKADTRNLPSQTTLGIVLTTEYEKWLRYRNLYFSNML